MPIISEYIDGDLGFYICFAACFMVGLLNTMFLSSVVGFASIFKG